jgi:hypothetical protein
LPFVGNDVVDLTDPENRGKSRDRRFVNRVFTPAEQRMISAADEADRVLWSLWAAKESAYKAISKMASSVCSIPRSYEVKLGCADGDTALRGIVETPAGVVHIRVFSGGGYVHGLATTGSDDDLDAVLSDVRRWEDANGDESARARTEGITFLSRYLGLPEDDIGIVSSSSIPRVTIRGLHTQLDTSLSHDGHYTACAFLPLNHILARPHETRRRKNHNLLTIPSTLFQCRRMEP